jgi:beta-phosphoglucomutase-like phosphatase (HAD superfamily)
MRGWNLSSLQCLLDIDLRNVLASGASKEQTMSQSSTRAFTIPPRGFHAVIFDLDGVVTKTARVHAAAWKHLFDEYLRERAERYDEPFLPFEIDTDYRQYVDGKPRYDGVRSFLEARAIRLPTGTPADSPGQETICGLGNRKNRFFQEQLAVRGVEVYESTVTLIRELRQRGIKTAIVSSSKNCVPVLRAAGLVDLFDAKVDGTDLERLGLQGKPKHAVQQGNRQTKLVYGKPGPAGLAIQRSQRANAVQAKLAWRQSQRTAALLIAVEKQIVALRFARPSHSTHLRKGNPLRQAGYSRAMAFCYPFGRIS